MNALQFLSGLRPALPLSETKDSNGSHKPMSGSELRRAIEQRSVLINTEPVSVNEEIDFPVFSVVFYPKSDKKRTTIV
jgi:hypothetical protein